VDHDPLIILRRNTGKIYDEMREVKTHQEKKEIRHHPACLLPIFTNVRDDETADSITVEPRLAAL
jgi:hypothetical protein